MENLLFSINATLPIFIIIVAGFFLKKANIISDGFTRSADTLVFKVCLPLLLFKEISAMDIYADFDITFVIFCAATTTAMFLLTWLFAALFIKDKSQVGAFAQAAARGSASILGVALVENIYGNAGSAPMMIIAAVPLYNILSVIILTLSAAGGKISRKTIKSTLKNIATNPIIIGILLGIPFAVLKISLTAVIQNPIDSIAGMTTPLALIVIGASFNAHLAKTRIRTGFAGALVKLLIIPAAFFPLALCFDFSGSEFVALLIMFGSPTTVSSYIMAKKMGGDEVLTSNIIMLSTLFSSFTLTFWIFLLRALGRV